MTSLETYQQKLSSLAVSEKVIKKRRRNISLGRFFIIVLMILWAVLLWSYSHPVSITGFIVGLAVFLYLVSRDVDALHSLKTVRLLIQINRSEVQALDYNFSQRETGERFRSDTHPYLEDMDIFGNHSIFQYVNRCHSEQGQNLLAASLSAPVEKSTIEERQQAVRVLSRDIDLRQHIEAYGTPNPMARDIKEKTKNWLETENRFTGESWRWLCYIYPVITLGSLYLYLDDKISGAVFSLLFLVFLVFSFLLSLKVQSVWKSLSKTAKTMDTIYQQLRYLELMKPGDSKLLQQILEDIKAPGAVSASAAVKQLKSILHRFDVRLNIFAFILLNSFLLWDLRQSIVLFQWKQHFGHKIAQWVDAIAQMEALCSLGTLAFNNPDWSYPQIASEYFTLEGEAIGHPLINKKQRVPNSFSLSGQGKVGLITGSNMGGKSTFLRSLGCNIVLAYTGAPVCAESFKVSVTQLMSSMRVGDNLAENTSTFYAELKKLRTIIQAINKGEKVFILLDEILRGTNSLDMHAGSEALMEQLIKKQAVAVIATHDVALAKLVKDYPEAIENYHFDVQVDNDNKLYFDYKLKPGICQRMNATILMREIGIEL